MKFYHGTSDENYNQIIDEGVLWGLRGTFQGRRISRCTYLAVHKEDARQYGNVLLEVEYDPTKSEYNNFCEDCWQIRVYEPISLNSIKRI